MVRISVNTSTCVGAAQCVLAAPEVFDQGEDGFVELQVEQLDGAPGRRRPRGEPALPLPVDHHPRGLTSTSSLNRSGRPSGVRSCSLATSYHVAMPIYPLAYLPTCSYHRWWFEARRQDDDPGGLWPVAEVTADDRARVPIGRAGAHKNDRYAVSQNDEGAILLTPLVSIPKRELLVWENEELRASLFRGLADAAEGNVRELSWVTADGEEDEDDE